MGTISIRYWASARSAAGMDAETLAIDAPITLSEVLRRLGEEHPESRLLAVLDACSVLLGDRPVSTEDPDDVLVAAGDTLEFLPPFAGG
ncbi:MoaD/ThiS family protein [Nocardioides sp.]|uniref:MoaD/ThiS family protein n=1 Tax=Nocardioides sp. TaxID=35761 RepID=UPI002B26B775|nr:MoaD/ThiS family protein [Nocardioides sp.]